MSAASSGEKNVPCALCATARRKSPAARGIASSAATDPPPADSPKTVTRPGSPPNASDVVTDPLQGGDLVEQAPVGGRPLDLREALDADAVVERHHDDAAVPREAAAVVFGQAGHADRVGAAVDPDHHRQPRARARLGRPDVDRQPVVVRGVPAPTCPSRTQRPAAEAVRTTRPPAPRPSPGPAAVRRSEARRPAARRTGCPGRPPHPPPTCRGPFRPCVRTSGRDADGMDAAAVVTAPSSSGRSSGIDRRLAVARAPPGPSKRYSHGAIRPIDSRSGSATTPSSIAIGGSGAHSRVAEQGHGRPPHGHPRWLVSR